MADLSDYLDKRALRSQKLRLPSTSPSTKVSPFQAMQAMLPMLPCNREDTQVLLERYVQRLKKWFVKKKTKKIRLITTKKG